MVYKDQPTYSVTRYPKGASIMCETCGCQGTVSAMSTTDSVSTPADTPPLVERISDSLQNGVKVVIGSNRKPPRRLKSLLR
jgi:hypothetical protein